MTVAFTKLLLDFEKNTNSQTKKDLHSWNKSETKALSSDFGNFDYEKEGKQSNKGSTLSLHTEPYENSIQSKTEKPLKQNGLIKKQEKRKQIFADSITVIQNLFEFPRQQNYEASDPEIAQFRASQRLRNPNQSNQRSFRQFSRPTSGGPSVGFLNFVAKKVKLS
uniref:Uncharacterized protein n=1 Tax=Panagrolaimus davidi TaxID=227884 RepID=A0A914P999_9BILA